jgi:hypothetical protein
MAHLVTFTQPRAVANLRPLITHILPFQPAAEALRLLDETPEKALQVVLDFGHA